MTTKTLLFASVAILSLGSPADLVARPNGLTTADCAIGQTVVTCKGVPHVCDGTAAGSKTEDGATGAPSKTQCAIYVDCKGKKHQCGGAQVGAGAGE